MSDVTLKMKMSPTAAGKLFQKACRLEDENIRLQSEVERLRGLAESEIMGFMSVAVEICRQEADEWDSDRVQTAKNYAEVCGHRIEKLTPGYAKAHILEKQAEAVEAAIEWLHNQYPKLDGPHLGLLTTRVQRLRQQAAESAGGEDAL